MKSTLQTVWCTGLEQSCFKITVKHFANSFSFQSKAQKSHCDLKIICITFVQIVTL